jgi:uncharacterized membrane protein/protein-disulfide isomerase
VNDPPETPVQRLGPTAPIRWTLRAVLVAALALSIYLSWVFIAERPLAGCGGADGCESVLTSRWAKWLGIPVSFGAVAVYGSMLAASIFLGPRVPRRVSDAAGWTLTLLAAVAIGAAVWFVVLQVAVLGHYCLYCIATHVCAIAAGGIAFWSVPRDRCVAVASGHEAQRFPTSGNDLPEDSASNRRLAMAIGAAMVAVLVAGQLAFESPGYVVESIAGGSSGAEAGDGHVVNKPAVGDDATVADGGSDENAAKSRPLQFGALTIDAWQFPVLGSPDAEHVVVKFFDYTCGHCRERHRQLEDVRRHYDDRLSILLLPAPLNSACNKYFRNTGTMHEDACVYSRLALAVWRAAPEQFEVFHERLFDGPEPPPRAEARRVASDLVGKSQLDDQLSDYRLSKQLSQSVAMYGATQSDGKRPFRIPRLLVGDKLIDGKFKSSDELLKVIQRQLP